MSLLSFHKCNKATPSTKTARYSTGGKAIPLFFKKKSTFMEYEEATFVLIIYLMIFADDSTSTNFVKSTTVRDWS